MAVADIDPRVEREQWHEELRGQLIQQLRLSPAARRLIEHLSYIESPQRRDVRDLALLVDEQWRARAQEDT